MKSINITVSVEDELYPIVEQITKYTGLIPFKTGIYNDNYYIYFYIVNKNKFDLFLHTEFNTLIDVLKVTEEKGITVLEWPKDKHEILLKEIENIKLIPNV